MLKKFLSKKWWLLGCSLIFLVLLLVAFLLIPEITTLQLYPSKKLSLNLNSLTGKSDTETPNNLTDEEKKHNDKKLQDAKDTPPPAANSGECAWPDAVLVDKSGNDLSVVVDKGHCLSSTYAPTDLVDIGQSGIRKTKSSMLIRSVIIQDLAAMVTAIKASKLDISALSCYRSYARQVEVYNNSVQSIGQTQTDKVSARPGHSEHQLGTTCDFGTSENGDFLGLSFGNTKTFTWLKSNAGQYGFQMSYPEGQSATTGYSYEPWHWRYVGK